MPLNFIISQFYLSLIAWQSLQSVGRELRETFTNFGFIGSSIITASGRWYLVVSGEKLRESELAKEQEREREGERVAREIWSVTSL